MLMHVAGIAATLLAVVAVVSVYFLSGHDLLSEIFDGWKLAMFRFERSSEGHISVPARLAGPMAFIPCWESVGFTLTQMAFVFHIRQHRITSSSASRINSF